MLPAGKATNSTIELLSEKLSAADILIDGGNSNYKDNLEQNKLLTEKGIKFLMLEPLVEWLGLVKVATL